MSDPNQSIRRVLAFPAHHAENEVIDIIYDPMRAKGIETVPFDWLWCAFSRVDVFHVHWPDAVVMGNSRARALLKSLLFLMVLLSMRLRRIPVVHHVHNVASHDQRFPRLEAFVVGRFLRQCAQAIHMNNGTIEKLKARYPQARGTPVHVIPHPVYRPFPDAEERAAARAAQGYRPDEFVILNFGLIRRYKGIDKLVRAFVACSEGGAERLVIAGKAHDRSYADELVTLGAGRVEFDFRFLPQDALEERIMAADLVVLPHTKADNSGTALQAISLGTRMLVPNVPFARDLADRVGPGWVTPYDTFDENVLMAAISAPTPDAPPNLRTMQPQIVSDGILEVYQEAKQS